MPRYVQHPGTGETIEFDDQFTDDDVIRSMYTYNPKGFEETNPDEMRKIFARSIALDESRARQVNTGYPAVDAVANTALDVKSAFVGSVENTLPAIADTVSAFLRSDYGKNTLKGLAQYVMRQEGIDFGDEVERQMFSEMDKAAQAGSEKAQQAADAMRVVPEKELGKVSQEGTAGKEAWDFLSPRKLPVAVAGALGTTVSILATNAVPVVGTPLAIGNAFSQEFSSTQRMLRERYPEMPQEDVDSWAAIYAAPASVLEYGGALAQLSAATGRNILKEAGINLAEDTIERLGKTKLGKTVLAKAFADKAGPLAGVVGEIGTENLQNTLQTEIVEGRFPTLEEYAATTVIAGLSAGTFQGVFHGLNKRGSEKLVTAQTEEEKAKVVQDEFPVSAQLRNKDLIAQYITGEIDADTFKAQMEGVGYSPRHDIPEFDVVAEETPEARVAALQKIDPRLHTALETAGDQLTTYDLFKKGDLTLEGLYSNVQYAAGTGDYSAFSIEQKYAIQDGVFKGNILSPRTNHTNDPNRTLPFDRSEPLFQALHNRTGVTENVARMTVEGVEDVLWNMAQSTVDPQTNKPFASLGDFVNSPDGRLQFSVLTEQAAKKANPDYDALAPDETYAGWFTFTDPEGNDKSVFDYQPGDHSLINLVVGNADTSTIFHELTHFMLTRVTEGSPLERDVLGFVNEHLKKKGDKKINSVKALDSESHEAVARLTEVYLLNLADVKQADHPAEVDEGKHNMFRVIGEEMRRLYQMSGMFVNKTYDVPELGTFQKPSQMLSKAKSQTKNNSYNLKAALDGIFYGGTKKGSFTIERAQEVAESFSNPSEPEILTEADLEQAYPEMASATVENPTVSSAQNTPERVADANLERETATVGPVSAVRKAPPRNPNAHPDDPLSKLMAMKERRGKAPSPAKVASMLGISEEAALGVLEQAFGPNQRVDTPVSTQVWFQSEGAQNLFNIEQHLEEIAQTSRTQQEKERKQATFINAVAKETGLEGYRGKKKSADARQAERRGAIDRMVAASQEYRAAVARYADELTAGGMKGVVHIDALDPTSLLSGQPEPGIGSRFYQTQKVKNKLPDTKVVDERGMPRRVYHGTLSVFNKFDSSKFGKGAGGNLWGEGFYFTEEPKVASGYATRSTKEESAAISKVQNELWKLLPASEKNSQVMHNASRDDLVKRAEEIVNSPVYSWDEKDNLYTALKDYKSVEKPSNVHMVYLDLKNPLDVDSSIYQGPSPDRYKQDLISFYQLDPNTVAQMTPHRAVSLWHTMANAEGRNEGLKGSFEPNAERIITQYLGDDQSKGTTIPVGAHIKYQSWGDVFNELLAAYGMEETKQILAKELGTDGITHIGQSGARQWIAWRDDQVHNFLQLTFGQKQKKEPKPTLDDVYDSVSEKFQRGRGVERPGFLKNAERQAKVMAKDKRVVDILLSKLKESMETNTSLLTPQEFAVLHQVFMEQMVRVNRLIERGGPYADKELAKFKNGLEEKFNYIKGYASDIMNLSRAEVAFPTMMELANALTSNKQYRKIHAQIFSSVTIEDLKELDYAASTVKTVQEFIEAVKKNERLSRWQHRVLSRVDFDVKDEQRLTEQISEAMLLMNRDQFFRELFNSYYVANILSNPGGRARDLRSNMFMHLMGLYVKMPIDATLELVTSMWTGQSRTKFVKDAFISTDFETGKVRPRNPLQGGAKGVKLLYDILRGHHRWQDWQMEAHVDLTVGAHAPTILMKYGNWYEKKIGTIMDMVPRTIVGIDAFQRTISEEVMGDVVASRMATWSKQGVLGEQLRRIAEDYVGDNQPPEGMDREEWIKELMTRPMEMTKTAAHDFANYVTFQNKPGPLTQVVLKGRELLDRMWQKPASAVLGGVPVLRAVSYFSPGRIIVPFIPTLANVMKFAMSHTPVTLGQIAAGGIAPVGMFEAYGLIAGGVLPAYWDQQKGASKQEILVNFASRQIVAHGLYLFLSWAMDNDWFVGAPESPEEADAWKRNGIKPYSFKVTWDNEVGYIPIPDPLTLSLVPVIQAIQLADRKEGAVDEKEATKIINKAIFNLQVYLKDSSYLGEALRLSNDASAFNAGRVLAGWLPFSGFMRAANVSWQTWSKGSATYPDTRQAQKEMTRNPSMETAGKFLGAVTTDVYGESFTKFFGQVIPGMEDEIPERITYFGKELTKSEILGLQLPWSWSPEVPDITMDKVEAEFANIRWYPGLPDRKVERIGGELKAEEYRSYCLQYGENLKKNIGLVLGNPFYQKMDRQRKAEYLSKLATDARQAALKKVLWHYYKK